MSVSCPLFTGALGDAKNVSFETFPHAVASALAGEVVSARRKSTIRCALLKERNIEKRELKNIDYVDAALCALTAQCLLDAKINKYGGLQEGFIVVPQTSSHSLLMAFSARINAGPSPSWSMGA